MTKKQAKARKEAWNKALQEGRVVRFNDGMEFRSFPTAQEAEQFRLRMRAQDVDAKIVVPPQTYWENNQPHIMHEVTDYR